MHAKFSTCSETNFYPLTRQNVQILTTKPYRFDPPTTCIEAILTNTYAKSDLNPPDHGTEKVRPADMG